MLTLEHRYFLAQFVCNFKRAKAIVIVASEIQGPADVIRISVWALLISGGATVAHVHGHAPLGNSSRLT